MATSGIISLSFLSSDLFPDLVDWSAIQAELCAANPEAEACQRVPNGDVSTLQREALPQSLLIPPSSEHALGGRLAGAELDFNAKEKLAGIVDVTHPAIGDGQVVTYTISYVNRGTDPSTGLILDVTTWGPIRLPDGDLISDQTGEFYHLLLPLGDLAPGESKEMSFQGVVDLSFDTQNNIGWGTIDAVVYDDRGNKNSNQIDWLYVDHEVDSQPPSHIEIESDWRLLAEGENTISGLVHDESAVPTIFLEVEEEGSERQTIECQDETPLDGQWSCPVNLFNSNDVQIRAKAVDEHGNMSDWSERQTFVVDSVSPLITLDDASQEAISDGIIGVDETTLRGIVSDNHLINRLEVCRRGNPLRLPNPSRLPNGSETCDVSDINVDIPQKEYVYEDIPATALPLGADNQCDVAGELIRTFVVEESFTVEKVEVGLNITHPYRNDVVGYLYSPSNRWQTILANGTSAANIDVLLSDSARMSSTEDEGDHTIGSPTYQNERQPFAPLSMFKGDAAQGEWRLILCDLYPEMDDGTYHQSRLILTADTRPENTSGSWDYTLDIDEDTQQPLAIYALDSVGNRSTVPLYLNLTLDNVAPTITPTIITENVSLLARDFEVAGLVYDASGISSMGIRILDPNGDWTTDVIDLDTSQIATRHSPIEQGFRENRAAIANRQLTNLLFLPLIGTSGTATPPTTSSDWVYNGSDWMNLLGTYTFWIEATDEAGNIQEAGPFVVEVLPANDIYLPLLSGGTGEEPAPPPADLTVSDFFIVQNNTADTTTIQLYNNGQQTITDEFRVDIYFDPTSVPTTTLGWQELSAYGGYWLVDQPIAPAETITITVGDAEWQAAESNYPQNPDDFLEAYIQVDTMNDILESHEQAGESNNNFYGPWALRNPETSDLVLVDVSLTPDNDVTIQIANQGTISTEQTFRVELYFDPVTEPVVLQSYNEVSTYGAYWLVDQALAAGETITLNLNDAYYQGEESNYPTAEAWDGINRYDILLDTLNDLLETPELEGDFESNHYGPYYLTEAPDIMVSGALITTTNSITPTNIQLTNIGATSISENFRVDLYFDPSETPDVNAEWDTLSEYGTYWLIDDSFLPIEAGQTITLTLENSQATGTNYPASFEGLSNYYIQVDTLDQLSEIHELRDTSSNNISGPVPLADLNLPILRR